MHVCDDIRLELIYTFCEARNYSGVVEMLQELQNEIDQQTQRTTLSRLFRAHGSNHLYHHTIVQAFKHTGNIPEIKSYYRKAVDDFQQDETKLDLNTVKIHWNISYHFAAMLYNQADAVADREEAVEMWEGILAEAGTEHRFMEPVKLSVKRLAWYVWRWAKRVC